MRLGAVARLAYALACALALAYALAYSRLALYLALIYSSSRSLMYLTWSLTNLVTTI